MGEAVDEIDIGSATQFTEVELRWIVLWTCIQNTGCGFLSKTISKSLTQNRIAAFLEKV